MHSAWEFAYGQRLGGDRVAELLGILTVASRAVSRRLEVGDGVGVEMELREGTNRRNITNGVRMVGGVKCRAMQGRQGPHGRNTTKGMRMVVEEHHGADRGTQVSLFEPLGQHLTP